MDVNQDEFLVKVGDGQYLIDIDGKQITTTPYPGRANLCAYATAAKWANFLRQRSYRNAIVVDIYGQPVNDERLRQALQVTRESAVAPLPTSREQLDCIPAAEALRRYKKESAFRARVEELEKQPRVSPKARRQ